MKFRPVVICVMHRRSEVALPWLPVAFVGSTINMAAVDGESHAAVANISLPFGPLSSPGLHNHWSEYPSSV